MFRIIKDPSSGSPVQYLAKITIMVLSCPLTWSYMVLWQHILPVVCVCSSLYRKGLHTHTTGRICCHNTIYDHVNGHDRTIIVILAKYCIRLPDDGSFMIRNILEHF